MEFAAVSWLWALWLLPALVLLLRFARSRARRRTAAFLGGMAPRLVENGGSQAWRAGLLVAALAVAVVGLARPAWGVWYEEIQHQGVEVVVVLDVSRSMLAQDATPDRLGRAKIAVGKLVDRLAETGGHRIGLLAFAGTPSVRCPLTLDYQYFRTILDRTGPGSAPRGGTLIGDALRRGREMFGGDGNEHRAMILLTDGEDHESFPIEAAKEVAQDGIQVYTVGIGDTATGRPIPVNAAPGGATEYLTHQGERVISRLDEKTLQQIARITGGVYVPAGTRAIMLGRIYQDAVESRAGSVHAVTMERRLHERFQWLVAAAIVLALASQFAVRRPYEGLADCRGIRAAPVNGGAGE